MDWTGLRICALLVLLEPPLAAQNLVVNPDLDADPASWELGCGVDLLWQAVDEAACPGSGSLIATGSGPCGPSEGVSFHQCVPFAGPGTVWLAGRVRTGSGTIAAAVEHYGDPACTTLLSGPVFVAFGPATGEWQTLASNEIAVPAGVQAVRIGLGAAVTGAVEVEADAAYLGTEPIAFRDDFEGNLGGSPPACRWSVVVP
jgi:hypothetical protein